MVLVLSIEILCLMRQYGAPLLRCHNKMAMVPAVFFYHFSFMPYKFEPIFEVIWYTVGPYSLSEPE